MRGGGGDRSALKACSTGRREAVLTQVAEQEQNVEMDYPDWLHLQHLLRQSLRASPAPEMRIAATAKCKELVSGVVKGTVFHCQCCMSTACRLQVAQSKSMLFCTGVLAVGQRIGFTPGYGVARSRIGIKNDRHVR